MVSDTETLIAPLSGLEDCDFAEDEYQIDEELCIIRKPLETLDLFWGRVIGEDEVENVRSMEWGFKYIRDIKGLDEENYHKDQDLVIRIAILALWITRPTGAGIRYLYKYQEEDGKRINETLSENFDWFHPLPKYEREILTIDHFKELREIYRILKRITSYENPVRYSIHFLGSALFQHSWDSRFILFTIVLESIFSTDSQEISHKISERVAFFLRDEFPDPADTFKVMKEIYCIRSRIAHGKTIPKKYKNILEWSEKLETFVQVLIKKILSDTELLNVFLAEDKIREEYFTKLIFRKT